jgi:hypothetical protein
MKLQEVKSEPQNFEQETAEFRRVVFALLSLFYIIAGIPPFDTCPPLVDSLFQEFLY